MDQNILTRQMQNQYVEQHKRWEAVHQKELRTEDIGPFALAVVIYLAISTALTWGLGWLGNVLWGDNAAYGVGAFVAFATLMAGGVFCGAVGWTGWVDRREDSVKFIQNRIRNDRWTWWSQVSDLLEQSGRGKLYQHVGSSKTMNPERTLATPDGKEIVLTAFMKNGLVWLIDPEGDVLRRAYGDRDMTTVVGDDGTLMAVTGIAAKVMGENTDHPVVP